MNYNLRIREEVQALETGPTGETGSCPMSMNGNTRDVSITPISGNHLNLRVDGRSRSLFVAVTDEGTWVWVNGRARLVQDADKAQRRKSSGPGGGEPTEVTPPTPATVVRIMVEMGQEVEKGAKCAVVTAMKMEYVLPAPYAGTITAINAEAGDAVDPGDVLVEIEPNDEESGDE